MFTIGQMVYHKFLHQECTVVSTHVEPEFVWSDGKVDPAFDWVDVKLDDGSVVGGNAKAFYTVDSHLVLLRDSEVVYRGNDRGMAELAYQTAKQQSRNGVMPYAGATIAWLVNFSTYREYNPLET